METAALLSLIGLLIGLAAVGVPLLIKRLDRWREGIENQMDDMKKCHGSDINALRDDIEAARNHRGLIKDKLIRAEAKLDMVLDRQGYDVPKVNAAIKDHMEELKENGTPSVGCIVPSTLYKE